MSGMNPVVLMQMILNYSTPEISEDGRRVFAFMKNERMRVHAETEEEVKRRKSYISETTRIMAYSSLRKSLAKVLSGRLKKKVWIDWDMKKIAIPLETSSSVGGYGILPTGSRVDIPEGKIIRAFTYWEKVNDIDLSSFAVNTDGSTEEFSWRSMWRNQAKSGVTFSGDVTNGYNGGSEYMDIDPEIFVKSYPNARYIVFCDNIYSGGNIHFKDVICRAGFMMRESISSGEIYEPSTVKTSFIMNADSDFGYLFAIDLVRHQMVWLNLARNGNNPIAGERDISFIRKYLNATDVLNVYDLYSLAGEATMDISEAEILVTDRDLKDSSAEVVHSYDIEKMLKLLSKGD